jgi:hypothetical protein
MDTGWLGPCCPGCGRSPHPGTCLTAAVGLEPSSGWCGWWRRMRCHALGHRPGPGAVLPGLLSTGDRTTVQGCGRCGCLYVAVCQAAAPGSYGAYLDWLRLGGEELMW